MTRRDLSGLGSLQAEVMELVWQQGEATVAELVKRISQDRPVSYTTVLVAMQKLEKKGWLAHRTAGRAYVYRPAHSRQQVRRRLLRDLLHSAFKDDPRLLLASLLDESLMDDEELEDLRKLIDEWRKEKHGE
jgi:BlaI family penicillinase repressor